VLAPVGLMLDSDSFCLCSLLALDGCPDGCSDDCVDGCSDGCVDGCSDVCVDGCADGFSDGCPDDCSDDFTEDFPDDSPDDNRRSGFLVVRRFRASPTRVSHRARYFAIFSA